MKIILNLILALVFAVSLPVFATQNDTQSNIRYAPMSADGYRIGSATTDKISFYDVATPVNQPDALTAQLTSITLTAPTTADYALQDMTNSSPWGFADGEEARTFTNVVKNLQERLAEVEARLEELGLINAN